MVSGNDSHHRTDIDSAEDPRLQGKRGVAIVLVIGMLAMLMIAASAFSISMRIERRGAANFRHSVQARHIMMGALAKAMDDIDAYLDDRSANYYVYPYFPYGNGLIMVSTGNIPARVMSGEVQRDMPGSLWNEMINPATPTPAWMYIYDTTTNSTVRGRYAYMAVNASGLVDANVVASTNRAFGRDAGEIQGLISVYDPASIKNQRDRRYESWQELVQLNLALCNELGGTNDASGVVHSLSYYPTNKINIGGTAAELQADVTRIMDGLVSAGVPNQSKSFVFNSLIDYLDPDCHPNPAIGLNRPNVESFPMVNEVILNYTFSAPNTLRISPVNFEFCYPFLNRRAESFDFDAEINLTVTIDGSVNQNASLPLAKKSTTYASGDDSAVQYYGQMAFPSAITLVTNPAANVLVFANITVSVYDASGSVLVDQAQMTNAVIYNVAGGNFQPAAKMSLEVEDPRFNWRVQDWKTQPGIDTYKALNNSATAFWASKPEVDSGIQMYTSDLGRLRNVGELGQLLEGSQALLFRFKTLRLYDDPARPGYTAHNFSDVFCITNGWRKGLINVNTDYSDVLAMAFKDASNGLRPADTRCFTIDKTKAQQIANAIMDTRETLTPKEFKDVSQIKNLSATTWPNLLPEGKPGISMSDTERELVMGSAMELLTTRQNLFAIVLSGEAYSPFSMTAVGQVDAGRKLASSRAVAYVWRDPYRDVNGVHRMTLLSLRLLEDD